MTARLSQQHAGQPSPLPSSSITSEAGYTARGLLFLNSNFIQEMKEEE